MSSVYSGVSAPNEELFFVDGNFEFCDPCGLPVISYPLKGDSILSIRDIVYLAEGVYGTYPLGTFPNLQPWSPNQSAMVLEQEFMVAQGWYIPMALNTPYNPAWALGWQGETTTGYPLPSLTQLYLVTEGELQDMGAGISKIKRTWASIPGTRNELEQFSYAFPGYGAENSPTRMRVPFNVISRMQYDYFIYDDLDILALPLFPNGPRLDSTTGLTPLGLILNAQYYFSNSAGIPGNNFIDDLTGNGSGMDDTVPPLTQYQSIIPTDGTASTSNGLAAELIAESSTMTRWMGNIFERRTRFVIAQ